MGVLAVGGVFSHRDLSSRVRRVAGGREVDLLAARMWMEGEGKNVGRVEVRHGAM